MRRSGSSAGVNGMCMSGSSAGWNRQKTTKTAIKTIREKYSRENDN